MATNKRVLYVGGLADEVNEKVLQASNKSLDVHYLEIKAHAHEYHKMTHLPPITTMYWADLNFW